MARRGPDLLKLVALRRQKAEQALALLQNEIRSDERVLAALQAEIDAADRSGADFEAVSLSRRFGHVGLMHARLESKRAALSEKRSRLRAAQDVLRREIDSEGRLEKELRGC